MYSCLVTVLLLASAANSSGGQDVMVGEGGRAVCVHSCTLISYVPLIYAPDVMYI